MTILTKDRDNADLDIAAENRGGIEYPLNHLLDAAGTKIDPATEATLAAVNAKLPALSGGAVPVTGPLTDIQMRATAVPVSIASWAGLTDTQLRATAVPVSFTWSGLTDAQLRASAVPVSGPLTDAQLRAAAVPVIDPDAVALLRRLLQMLMSPLGYDKGQARQRGTAVIESGTLTTLTTLTTLANIAGIGGYSAQMQVMDTNRAAWALSVRARIT